MACDVLSCSFILSVSFFKLNEEEDASRLPGGLTLTVVVASVINYDTKLSYRNNKSGFGSYFFYIIY